jgi:cytoplasmic iron level regulating protein YaaA (DUF328/UPF0246 family)
VLILLPPSEGKTAPRRGKPLDLKSLAFPDLTPARERLLDALVDLCDGDPDVAAKTLGIGASQLGLLDLNREVRSTSTARADRIYSGVLYDALDIATLSAGAKRRATTRLAVTSSLFGLVRPDDRIPAYRLSGDTSLPGVGPIASYWRGQLDPVASGAVGSGLLIDLRSSTYAAFWRPTAGLAARVATVRVLHEVDGRRQVVSHFNKATKGRMVRALLENGAAPRTPSALAATLRDLGWSVEVGSAGPKGTQLDVVVSEL